MSWLASRGYAEVSSLELVGNRYDLLRRQREALRRSYCNDEDLARRQARKSRHAQSKGRMIQIDGFNLIILVESALAGGVLIRGRDTALRDLASVHGSYRRAEHTHAALDLIAKTLDRLGVARVQWLLDRPVSNSGRLAQWIRETARAAPHGARDWQVELVDDPDGQLIAEGELVVSSDGWIISQAAAWLDLPGLIVERSIPEAWLIDLAPSATPT